jgi:hypothetical protein
LPVLGTFRPLDQGSIAVAAAAVAARLHAASLSRELRTVAVIPAVGDEPVAGVALALVRSLEAEGLSAAVVGLHGDAADIETRAKELAIVNDFVFVVVPRPDAAVPEVDGALILARDTDAATRVRGRNVDVLGLLVVEEGEMPVLPAEELGAFAELGLLGHTYAAPVTSGWSDEAARAELLRRVSEVAVREAELDARERALASLQAEAAALAARGAEAAARERELQGWAAELELRAHTEVRSPGEPAGSRDTPVDDSRDMTAELAALVAEKEALEQHVARLESQAQEQDAFAAELALRETAVRRSEGERAAESAQTEQLARHDAQLRAREEALAVREAELDERARRLAEREGAPGP